MSASDWPLQQAIFTALDGDVTLSAAISGVFDSVEQDYEDYPYVTIGENIQTPFDTDDQPGDDNSFAVHVWSREGGRKEAKIVNGYIYDILNRNNLSVTGYETVDCIAEGSSVEIDPDGKTYHGINNFKCTLREV
tara:strand:- start:404 stop:808 length:405 start_codon:yes stop_codon:yes gene_type:complete